MRILAFTAVLLAACESVDGVGGLTRSCEAKGGKVVDSKMGEICADADAGCRRELHRKFPMRGPVPEQRHVFAS